MVTEIILDHNIYRFLEWPYAWSVHVHLGYCRLKELQEVWTRPLGEPCNLDLSNRRSGSVESWRPILTDENTVGIWILIIWVLETLEYRTFLSSHFKWLGMQMIGLWAMSNALDRRLKYSGDLNNEHLNNGNIWITNFYLSGIQMSVIQMVFQIPDKI